MLGNRTECTTTKTTSHDIHRSLDHVVGWNPGIAVTGMWSALIRQIEHPVHLIGGQGNWRRVNPDLLGTVLLYQRLRVIGICFLVQYAGGVGVQSGVICHFIKRGQANIACLRFEFSLALQGQGNDSYG